MVARPDQAMTAFMNRSIDLIEGIARATGNRIGMNRRGYLFATAEPGMAARLEALALTAQGLGSGPVRVHGVRSRRYQPSPALGFEAAPTGADIITDRNLIRRHFPQLAPETVAVLHARRAGWLSAQQLGMVMLERARAKGVKLLRAKVVGVRLAAGCVRAVEVERDGERQSLPASELVIAAGPMQKEIAALIGIDLPVFAERHLKISFPGPARRRTACFPDADLARSAVFALERGGARRPCGRAGDAMAAATVPAGRARQA